MIDIINFLVLKFIVCYLSIIRKIYDLYLNVLHIKTSAYIFHHIHSSISIDELVMNAITPHISIDYNQYYKTIDQINQWINSESDAQFCNLYPDGTVQFQQTFSDTSKLPGTK